MRQDDGYYELTKEGGGEYDWDYVYIKDWVFDKQRYWDNELIAPPTYFEAARFLQEKYNYLIVVKPFEGDFETPMLELKCITKVIGEQNIEIRICLNH